MKVRVLWVVFLLLVVGCASKKDFIIHRDQTDNNFRVTAKSLTQFSDNFAVVKKGGDALVSRIGKIDKSIVDLKSRVDALESKDKSFEAWTDEVYAKLESTVQSLETWINEMYSQGSKEVVEISTAIQDLQTSTKNLEGRADELEGSTGVQDLEGKIQTLGRRTDELERAPRIQHLESYVRSLEARAEKLEASAAEVASREDTSAGEVPDPPDSEEASADSPSNIV